MIRGCSASGTVTATAPMDYEGMAIGVVGVGGLAGCAFDTREVIDCKAEGVVITVGEHASMVGGLLGYPAVGASPINSGRMIW